jgi:AcrR family transcriptional regulator
VIAERGVAATRIADVAERSGVSPPAVLYWFDSKEKLLAEALVADDESFYERLAARLAPASCSRERLALLIDVATDESDDFALWMELWTWSLRDEELRRARERFDARWRGEIEAIVRSGQEEGDFGAIDPAEAGLAIASLIDGLTVQVALGDPEVSKRRMRAAVLSGAGRLLECELEVGEAVRPASP